MVYRGGQAFVLGGLVGQKAATASGRAESPATAGGLRLPVQRVQCLVSGRNVARSHVRLDEVALPVHDVRLAELMAFGQSAGVLKRPDRLFHTAQAKLSSPTAECT